MLPACFLHASCVLPSILLLNVTVVQETHTILSTFLGSTQEAHMGATCVLPSVASLTGRSVPISLDIWIFLMELAF